MTTDKKKTEEPYRWLNEGLENKRTPEETEKLSEEFFSRTGYFSPAGSPEYQRSKNQQDEREQRRGANAAGYIIIATFIIIILLGMLIFG